MICLVLSKKNKGGGNGILIYLHNKPNLVLLNQMMLKPIIHYIE